MVELFTIRWTQGLGHSKGLVVAPINLNSFGLSIPRDRDSQAVGIIYQGLDSITWAQSIVCLGYYEVEYPWDNSKSSNCGIA